MMVGGMCSSVQAALDDLFGQLDDTGVRVRGCTDRAFAKARKGISYTVFEQLNAHLLTLAAPKIDQHRWRGLRVVAADGSRLRVATRRGAELEADHYALVLYLPGSELTLHAALGPADASERQMMFEALEHTDRDDLLVLDRGYPGNTMAAAIVQQGRHFCMRVDACGWRCVRDFLRSGKSETVATLGAPSARDAATYELRREPTCRLPVNQCHAKSEVAGSF
ncbi:transposase [Rhodanobacter terrae]|uniref:Transposase n=1 Tax=Rhodanobacter terrae TaxID=418647 RepID=A0ABW0T2X1_9GAMM